MDKKEQLKEILHGIKSRADLETLRAKAAQLFKELDPALLAHVEQELIAEGLPEEDLQKLCVLHLEILGGGLALGARLELPPDHPLDVMMAEHRVILSTLDQLEALVQKFNASRDFASVSDELIQLKQVAERLLGAEPHHEREEKVLFPRLERQGLEAPPRMMRQEHEEFRAQKKALLGMASVPRKYCYAEFAKNVSELGASIVRNLREHIFKEDNILYPAAVKVLEPDAWREVKRECDAVGYCPFTPGKSPSTSAGALGSGK